MKLKGLKRLIRHGIKWGSKHAPELLVGMGLVGMGAAVVSCAKEAPVAKERIEEATEEKGEELTLVEKTKATWKTYFPAALMFVVSAACIVGASTVNLKRNTALAAAYSLAESQLADLERKRAKELNLLPAKETKEDISKDGSTVTTKNIVIESNGDEEEFYCPLINETFKSTKADIRNSIARLNTDMANSIDGSVSVNDYAFSLCGLRGDSAWDFLGWNPSKNGRLMEVDFIPDVEPIKGKLVWKIVHRNTPFNDYM